MEIFEYQNQRISFDFGNGVNMINATEMAKGFLSKKVAGFLRLKQTQDFVKILEARKNNYRYADSHNGNEYKALRVIKGGNPQLQGTWMTEKLALKFAAWLSPDFELWVYDMIEELLKEKTVSIKPLTPAQLQLQQAQILVNIEQKQLEHDERILNLESKVNTSPDYFTVVGYASKFNVKVGRALAANVGRKSSRLCKQKGHDIGKVNDVRYGEVNSYPSCVLNRVFKELNLIK